MSGRPTISTVLASLPASIGTVVVVLVVVVLVVLVVVVVLEVVVGAGAVVEGRVVVVVAGVVGGLADVAGAGSAAPFEQAATIKDAPTIEWMRRVTGGSDRRPVGPGVLLRFVLGPSHHVHEPAVAEQLTIEQCPEVLDDALCEMLNVVCGHVVRALGGPSSRFDLQPPRQTVLETSDLQELMKDADTTAYLLDDEPVLMNLKAEVSP